MSTIRSYFCILIGFFGVLATSSIAVGGTPVMSIITVSPTAATIGATVTGTVEVSDKCLSTGCLIQLTSSNPSVAPVPASVTIPFDNKKKSFTFIAGTVSAKTIITITGTYAGTSKNTGTSFSVSPAVTPAPAPTVTSSVLNALSVSANNSASGAMSGDLISVNVSLNKGCTSSGGCLVSLSSSNPSAGPIPSTIFIGSGFVANTIYFTAGSVSTSTSLTFSANYNEVTKSVPFTISNTPPLPAPYMIRTYPTSPVTGQVVNVEILMALSPLCPVAGCTVSLASSDQTAAPLPATFTIPAGQNRASFSFVAGLVSTKTIVKLSASQLGLTVDTGTSFNVRPPWPIAADGSLLMQAVGAEVRVAPLSTQTAYYWQNALANLYADVDNNLYWQCQAAFPGQGQLVSSGAPVKSPIRFDGYSYFYSYTQSWVCMDGPYTGWLQTFGVSKLYVSAPASFTANICLTQAAPAGGIVIALTSNYPTIASIPASVTIPSGGLCQTVTITTKLGTGTAGRDVLFTAEVNGMVRFQQTTVYY